MDVGAALVRATGPDGCWEATAGTAHRRPGAPVPQDARFRIGSATKVFTAVVVLQLVAEHRESVEYQVEHRFDNWTPQQYVDEAFKVKPEAAPGSQQHYRNIGYIIAGMLIEKMTGTSYEDEVRDRLIRPLRLTGTSAPGNDPDIRGAHVHGYQVMSDGTLRDVTRWNQSFGWAAGAIISTTRDLDVFTAALLGSMLLPPEIQRDLFVVPAVPDISGKAASYSVALQRFQLPGVGEIWGKTGGRYGYLAGLGGTADGTRRLVYGVTANDAKNGDNPTPITQQIVLAGMTLSARQ